MIETRDKTNTPWGPRPLPKKGPKGGKAPGGTNGMKREPHTGGPKPF